MNQNIILWADDDADDKLLMNEALKEIDTSFLIVEACDGQEALGFLNKVKDTSSSPCLVILDLNMPLVNGKDVITIMKNDKDLHKIPVVVFTTSSNKKDKEFCESHKVEMILKPSTAEELIKALQEMLKMATIFYSQSQNAFSKSA